MSALDNDITTFKRLPVEQEVWHLLENVCDPEIPVLSIIDLGIVRSITCNGTDQPVTVTITPTYSGCPAMDVIAIGIRMILLEHGFKQVNIESRLSPAWTTDWMTAAGKLKLKEYGIAPPNAQHSVCTPEVFQQQQAVQCPQCNSFHTHVISRFASTACKALYQCDDCKEPFDYFKCH